jgi:SAM-dependent methyltransferase
MCSARWWHAFLRRYAAGAAAAIAPFVRGRRVLDLGAGEGYLAAALQRLRDVWVCSVDVGLFRRADGPYVTYDGGRLPFRDATFDTTALLLTLHHCAAPEAVMDEALRVTRQRLIVTESVFRNRYERFWLELLDGRLNRHRHHGQMPVALAFRRFQEWRQAFESRRLQVVEIRWLGSRWERLVHHPVLYVLDKVEANTFAPHAAARLVDARSTSPRGEVNAEGGVDGQSADRWSTQRGCHHGEGSPAWTSQDAVMSAALASAGCGALSLLSAR